MSITTSYAHVNQGSRYDYDFGPCSSRNGWAQFDTPIDASYFGIWVHPERRQVFTYCEGDLTTHTPAIDPGLGPQLRQRFCDIGAADLLHPEPGTNPTAAA